MSDDIKVNTLLLKQRFPLQSATDKNHIHFDINNQITREVSQNKTTAVEVIVKQINNKTKMKEPSMNLDKINLESLYKEMEKLKTELNSANTKLDLSKKCFTAVMFEMGKQLEAANQRDLKRQTKNLVLQLEKEKFKTILISKTNLVSKMRKELLNMKRIIKILSKSVRTLPYVPENVKSDSEYTEFENDLLKPKQFVVNSVTDDRTYETSMSINI